MGAGNTRLFPAQTLMFIVKSATNKLATSRDALNGLWDVNLNFLYDPMGFNKYRRLSQLISSGANAYKDRIIDMRGQPVNWYTESEWNGIDGAMKMDFNDFFELETVI
jgi:hypothetical protein